MWVLVGAAPPAEARGFRVDSDFPAVGRRVRLLDARKIIAEGTEKEPILLAFDDVTSTPREGPA